MLKMPIGLAAGHREIGECIAERLIPLLRRVVNRRVLRPVKLDCRQREDFGWVVRLGGIAQRLNQPGLGQRFDQFHRRVDEMERRIRARLVR